MKKLLLIGASALLISCVDYESSQPSVAEQQARKSEAMNEGVQYTKNNEAENILRRRKMFAKEGSIGFITLLNQAGQPIAYYTVDDKPTSSGKRLTNPVKAHRIDRGEYSGSALGPAPSDEGTWGSSSPYIYFWTTSGQYIQWSGDYLYSDQPYRLRINPLVIDSSGDISSQ